MRFFNWFLRILLFIALLGFAAKNDQMVYLQYFFGYKWQTPLVVALFLFFFAGAVVGVLAMYVNILQQRREISRLKHDIKARAKLADAVEDRQPPVQPL